MQTHWSASNCFHTNTRVCLLCGQQLRPPSGFWKKLFNVFSVDLVSHEALTTVAVMHALPARAVITANQAFSPARVFKLVPPGV